MKNEDAVRAFVRALLAVGAAFAMVGQFVPGEWGATAVLAAEPTQVERVQDALEA